MPNPLYFIWVLIGKMSLGQDFINSHRVGLDPEEIQNVCLTPPPPPPLHTHTNWIEIYDYMYYIFMDILNDPGDFSETSLHPSGNQVSSASEIPHR